MNTTLGKLHQEQTWVHFLINEVLELRLFHFNKLDEQRIDLDVDCQTFGLDGQKSLLITNRSQVPRVVRIISSLILQVGNRSELGEGKLQFPFGLGWSINNVLSRPLLLLIVPDADLWLIVLVEVNIIWQKVVSRDGLDLTGSWWVWLEF